MSDSDSSEDSSDWEEVNEKDYVIPQFEEESVKEYTQNLDIPVEGIKITIEGEAGSSSKGKKKGFDVAGYIRRQVNRRKKELQEDIHKTHLLCLLARGMYINECLISEDILAQGLSILPSKQSYPPKNIDLQYLEMFIKWFKKAFSIDTPSNATNASKKDKSGQPTAPIIVKDAIVSSLNSRKVMNTDCFAYVFIVILRALGVHVRLIISLQPTPLKPPASELLRDPNSTTKSKKSKSNNVSESKQETAKTSKKQKEAPGTSTSVSTPSRRAQTQVKKAKLQKDLSNPKKSKSDEVEILSSDSDSDSDFDLNKSKTSRKRSKTSKKNDTTLVGKVSKKALGKGRKMISSSEDESENTKTNDTKKKEKGKQFIDVWVEVYLEEEERWVSVDLVNAKIMCDGDFEVKASQPVIYVLAFGNDRRVKDVTRRYASRWLTATQKLRVDKDWWQLSLKPFIGKRTRRDKEEDEFLDQQLLNQAVPNSVQEVKNHPLFVLGRHLLKFEALYPPEPVPLGFIKNEAVYSRECVKTLHSRELWMRQAKVVRMGETPYKIVKARPKYDKMTSSVIKDRPLELFGEWQVDDYIPPPAKDGKVPRNEYGNVELFMEKMLPKGTVHLREPGLNRVAKKLDIDCAPALVGFDFHSGGSHPTYDGYIVCEEYKDLLLDAWREDQEEMRKKEEAKRVKRVRENWRRLIRLVIVRRRLERKYESFNFGSKGVKRATSDQAAAPSSSNQKSTKRRRKK